MSVASDKNSKSQPTEKSATIKNAPTPIISLRHVTRTFGFDDIATDALSCVNLEIQQGEFVAIMGPSGCGKTTLLNIISLLDEPTIGRYLFKGRDVSRFSSSRKAKIRNREIGIIFQNFNLINDLTVIENVALPLSYSRGLQYKNLEKASKLLHIVGLGTREYYTPNQLSGGQKQRVAIARALINRPAILLADEPTGNLDSANSKIIMDELARLHKEGNTILMVTHNPDLLKYASRVIQMKDGSIASDAELTGTKAYRVTKRTIRAHSYRSNRRKPRGHRK